MSGLSANLLVSYPRVAEVGKRYPLTVDLQHPLGDWKLEAEEYAVHFLVDASPAFTCEPQGDSAVIVHRFGGTYGPARFVLRAAEVIENPRIRITVLSAGGLPLRTRDLTDLRVKRPDPVRTTSRAPVRCSLNLREREPNGDVEVIFGNVEQRTESRRTVQLDPSWFESARARRVFTLNEGIELFEIMFGSNPAVWRAELADARSKGRNIRLEITAAGENVSSLPFRFAIDPIEQGLLIDASRSPRVSMIRMVVGRGRARPLELLDDKLSALVLARAKPTQALEMQLGRLVKSLELLGAGVWLPGSPGPIPASGSSARVFHAESLRSIKSSRSAIELSLESRRFDIVHVLIDDPADREFLVPSPDGYSWSQFASGLARHASGDRRGCEILFLHHANSSASYPYPTTILTDGAATAVVASRSRVSLEAGINAACSIYEGLARGEPLDQAMALQQRESSWDLAAFEAWTLPGALDARVERTTPTRAAEQPPPEPIRKGEHGKDDWALLIGIETCAGVEHPSALASTRAFQEWLLSPSGGRVSPQRSKLLLSSSIKGKDQPSAKGIVEALDEIEKAFRASVNGRLGRRLYIYLAGFGTDRPSRDLAFIAADGTAVDVRRYAVHFAESGAFDEVVMFTDYAEGELKKFPTLPFLVSTGLSRGSWLFAHHREAVPGETGSPSIFTRALLAGLGGRAADETGRVTSRGLMNFVDRGVRSKNSPSAGAIWEMGGAHESMELLPNEVIQERPAPSPTGVRPFENQLPSTPRAPSTKSEWKLWPNGTTLEIRFLGGTRAQRNTVKKLAEQWSRHANVHFAFTDRDTAPVRVAFDSQTATWCYLGTDCLSIAPKEPTMSFGEGFEERDVLRVFGHLLGLVLEHQSPNAQIPWITDVVERAMTTAHHSWTKESMRVNLFSVHRFGPIRVGQHEVEYRKFDPTSVMMHTFSPDWFSEPLPPPGKSLSDADKSFIAQLYPPNVVFDGRRDVPQKRRLAAREAHLIVTESRELGTRWMAEIRLPAGSLTCEVATLAGEVLYSVRGPTDRLQFCEIAKARRCFLRVYSRDASKGGTYQVKLTVLPRSERRPAPPPATKRSRRGRKKRLKKK